MIKTKLHYYKFDISNKEEKKQYIALSNKLKSLGYELFDSISLMSYEKKTDWFNKIKQIEKMGFIELETKFIFNNQWNTSETSLNLRVFDWAEEIYPNKDIKEGYYLDITQEIKDLRENTFKCGFCGKQYTQEEHKNLSFCSSCLGSEYLKEEDLFLLRLKRINDDSPRLPLNDCDKNALLEIYTSEQHKHRLLRLEQRKKREIASLKEKRKEAEIEYKGFMWLINHNIDFENVIYYGHTKKFCFGWLKPLNFEQEQKLKEILEYNNKDKFPYDYEIKT